MERTSGTSSVKKSRTGTRTARQNVPGPVLTIRRRRQMRPFLFSMGPVALSITSVLLIALMAVLYLSQAGQAVATNRGIQDMRSEQATLQRQNQDLTNIVAQQQSPAYIAEQAKKMGLKPADPEHVWIIRVGDKKFPMRETQREP